ncbi:hypothetical protein RBH29_11505 [Herbivorax sp. ANBcel31]|uniref:hypothetical protein n=1 Tax=Herbivorax sp. ANBcel31 TaxID=3069754 RepID=UPI0027B228A2|nr:hypothetical protein [Herbivorax sp. ANBcel31]MDQ2087054.1 hypothetical protein [Herbivorax sp. ANBcel31]
MGFYLEIYLLILGAVFLIGVASLFVSPNLSKTRFVEQASRVDISGIREYKYKISGLTYFKCCISIITLFMILGLSFMSEGFGVLILGIKSPVTDLLVSIFIIISLLNYVRKALFLFPRTYIKFNGNDVTYSNGKRAISFSIDDVEDILFEKYDKVESHYRHFRNFFRRHPHGHGHKEVRLGYKYVILCFKNKVPECQRVTFINEFLFFSKRKPESCEGGKVPLTYQLEFDIFNFEYPHEIFELLSQNVYIPIY